MNKKLVKLIILLFTITIFSSNIYAYDINNPKSPSKRSYTLGEQVTLINGTNWYVAQNCDADTSALTLLYEKYATLTTGQIVMTYNELPAAANNISTWLTNDLTVAGGDTTGLIVTSLNKETIDNLVAANGSGVWSWIGIGNYWLTTQCPTAGYHYTVNGSGGFSFAADSTNNVYGYRPYIAIMKSNIRGRRKVTIGSISNGTITSDVTYYDQDEKITLTVKPNKGYELRSGSLKYGSTAIGTDNSGNYAYLGPNSNTTVTATFDPINYTITYVDPKGVANPNPTNYNVESSTITLQNLSKDCYVFDGWYKNEALTNQVTQVSSGSTGNKTYYAKWSRDPAKAPSYEISIPSSLSLDSSNGTFDIAAGNLVNIGDGSVKVSLAYPTDGFKLSLDASNDVSYKLYKGTSAIANNEITSNNTLIAEFTSSGAQSLYYDIDDVRYPGTYSGSLTFNIDFIDNLN